MRTTNNSTGKCIAGGTESCFHPATGVKCYDSIVSFVGRKIEISYLFATDFTDTSLCEVHRFYL